MSEEVTTRSPMEIQRAHDLLVGIILGETPIESPAVKSRLTTIAAVLCWVLKHDHNKAFGVLLEEIEGELHEMGCILGGPTE